MYFSGEGDYIYWKMAVEDMLVSQKMSDYLANLCAKYPLTSQTESIVRLNALTPTVPAAEAETETTDAP